MERNGWRSNPQALPEAEQTPDRAFQNPARRACHRCAHDRPPVESPARLVDPEGALNQEMQRVYRLLDRDFEAPKKVLELNPRHPILVRLNAWRTNTQPGRHRADLRRCPADRRLAS